MVYETLKNIETAITRLQERTVQIILTSACDLPFPLFGGLMEKV